MEVPFGVIAIVGTAARVTSKTWSLSESWIDAPRDFHRLKDELARIRLFFDETKEGMMSNPATTTGSRMPPPEDDLDRLLGMGADIMRQLELIIDDLSGNEGLNEEGELRKRRRMTWMVNTNKISRLRSELGDLASGICRLLIVRNV